MTNRIKKIRGIVLLATALSGCTSINLDNKFKVYSGNRYTMSQVAASRLRTAAGLISGDVKVVRKADGEYLEEGQFNSDSQKIYDKLCILADIHPIDWSISDEEAEKIFWIAYGSAKNKEKIK